MAIRPFKLPNSLGPRPSVRAPSTGGAGITYTPDVGPISSDQYRQAIEAHPSYITGASGLRASDQIAAEQRRAAARQLAIQSGMIPQGYQDKFGDLDAATMQAAQANTQAGLSTQAMLEKAYQDQQRDWRNSLAARGMGRSGESVFAARESELADRQRRNQALQDLLGQFASLNQGYASGFAQNQNQLAELAQRVYDQYRQDLPMQIAATPGFRMTGPRRF